MSFSKLLPEQEQDVVAVDIAVAASIQLLLQLIFLRFEIITILQ